MHMACAVAGGAEGEGEDAAATGAGAGVQEVTFLYQLTSGESGDWCRGVFRVCHRRPVWGCL
jgi:hypothetical protein